MVAETRNVPSGPQAGPGLKAFATYVLKFSVLALGDGTSLNLVSISIKCRGDCAYVPGLFHESKRCKSVICNLFCSFLVFYYVKISDLFVLDVSVISNLAWFFLALAYSPKKSLFPLDFDLLCFLRLFDLNRLKYTNFAVFGTFHLKEIIKCTVIPI